MLKYDADCVASSFKINGKIPFSNIFSGTKVVEKDNIVSTAILSKNIHYVLWNKLYKTDILKTIEVNTDINFGEDLIFCYEYLSRCKRAVFINKYDYKYIMLKTSLIHKKFSQGNVAFLDWLEEAIKSETNENNNKALRAWIAFTSASFKYLMKKSKYKDEALTKRLNENIAKYNKDFTKNKFTRPIFKLAYRFTKGIK